MGRRRARNLKVFPGARRAEAVKPFQRALAGDMMGGHRLHRRDGSRSSSRRGAVVTWTRSSRPARGPRPRPRDTLARSGMNPMPVQGRARLALDAGSRDRGSRNPLYFRRQCALRDADSAYESRLCCSKRRRLRGPPKVSANGAEARSQRHVCADSRPTIGLSRLPRVTAPGAGPRQCATIRSPRVS